MKSSAGHETPPLSGMQQFLLCPSLITTNFSEKSKDGTVPHQQLTKASCHHCKFWTPLVHPKISKAQDSTPKMSCGVMSCDVQCNPFLLHSAHVTVNHTLLFPLLTNFIEVPPCQLLSNFPTTSDSHPAPRLYGIMHYKALGKWAESENQASSLIGCHVLAFNSGTLLTLAGEQLLKFFTAGHRESLAHNHFQH